MEKPILHRTQVLYFCSGKNDRDKFGTCDLHVVLNVVPDVIPQLNGIPSKLVKGPELAAAARGIMDQGITEYIDQYYGFFFQLI